MNTLYKLLEKPREQALCKYLLVLDFAELRKNTAAGELLAKKIYHECCHSWFVNLNTRDRGKKHYLYSTDASECSLVIIKQKK